MDKCSFCGKSEKFGVRLVRGPAVAICEECVKLAAEVIEGMPEPARPIGRIEVHAFRGAEAGGVKITNPDDGPHEDVPLDVLRAARGMPHTVPRGPRSTPPPSDDTDTSDDLPATDDDFIPPSPPTRSR